LVLTFAGVRGTVTVATVLTLPFYLADGSGFPHRDLIIFLASGVIIVTMVLANFVLPLLAPKESAELEESEVEITINILRSVLIQLNDHMTPKNRRATEEVVRSYNDRIQNIKAHNDVTDESRDQLRLKVFDWEKENTIELMQAHKINTAMSFTYLFQLNRSKERVQHKTAHFWWITALGQIIRQRRAVHKVGVSIGRATSPEKREELHTELTSLQLSNCEYVLGRLHAALEVEKGEHDHSGDAEIEDLSVLIMEYQRKVDRLNALGRGLTRADVKSAVIKRASDSTGAAGAMARLSGGSVDRDYLDQVKKVESYGFQLEREAITQMFDAGKLTRKRTKELRDSVALMELDLESDL
jgi:CPA1 family monovalent cation:H+ antiporter